MGEMVATEFLSVFVGSRVLITGHTGFKGPWLAFLLKEIGAEVLGYALPPEQNGSHLTALELLDQSIHHIEGDVRDLAVPVGRIRLAIYDDRERSIARGQMQVLELGRPDAYLRLRIPPGLWYGFGCLSDTPALLVNCADLPHDPTDSEVRPVNDSAIPYAWVVGSDRARNS